MFHFLRVLLLTATSVAQSSYPHRLVFIDETAVTTKMTRPRCPAGSRRALRILARANLHRRLTGRRTQRLLGAGWSHEPRRVRPLYRDPTDPKVAAG